MNFFNRKPVSEVNFREWTPVHRELTPAQVAGDKPVTEVDLTIAEAEAVRENARQVLGKAEEATRVTRAAEEYVVKAKAVAADLVAARESATQARERLKAAELEALRSCERANTADAVLRELRANADAPALAEEHLRKQSEEAAASSASAATEVQPELAALFELYGLGDSHSPNEFQVQIAEPAPSDPCAQSECKE